MKTTLQKELKNINSKINLNHISNLLFRGVQLLYAFRN